MPAVNRNVNPGSRPTTAKYGHWYLPRSASSKVKYPATLLPGSGNVIGPIWLVIAEQASSDEAGGDDQAVGVDAGGDAGEQRQRGSGRWGEGRHLIWRHGLDPLDAVQVLAFLGADNHTLAELEIGQVMKDRALVGRGDMPRQHHVAVLPWPSQALVLANGKGGRLPGNLTPPIERRAQLDDFSIEADRGDDDAA